ncbi:hypothetical protein SAMN05421548_1515 [Paraburkholderia lycopersici]|uniref:Uncharacterized protein n=1 Tax=Paraburkholderia lycopersici TaxID=416944 RepID=A0A1G7D3B7_9BURK|nr:hypothetical protein SAMN05421548_1515 [Paraburkholderia lycopersici]
MFFTTEIFASDLDKMHQLFQFQFAEVDGESNGRARLVPLDAIAATSPYIPYEKSPIVLPYINAPISIGNPRSLFGPVQPYSTRYGMP